MMVYVPPEENLPDALDRLDEFARERLLNSETKLIDHIDRLIRLGTWPSL
ncbi:hypothetical protein [Actinomadura coerulea]